MKYSAIVATAFAAGAMARAVPNAQSPTSLELDQLKQKNGGEDYDRTSSGADDYDRTSSHADDYGRTSSHADDYGRTSSHADDYGRTSSHADDYGRTSSKADDYGRTSKSDDYDNKYQQYQKEQKDYDNKYYTPYSQPSYDDNYDDKSHKYYSPQPPSYNKDDSCYHKFEWPTNVHKEKSCNIKWSPKHGDNWDDDDDTVIELYHCKDYSKPHSKVCDDCGKGSYDKWQPPKDCESSDVKGGAYYRFKFSKKSDKTKYTWGCEFPIYGDKYDNSEESTCEPPKPVPDCPSTPPTPPAKEEAPTTYAPAPAPEAAPAASYPAPAEAAPAATYPTQGVANETEALAPAMGSSSSIRASVSVIVGVAALITFAL